jgi:hypothetical protein
MIDHASLTVRQWGQNSGHVGVPLEAIPGFIQRLQAMYQKTTGEPVSKKSPAGKSQAASKGVTKGGKKGKTKVIKVQEKKKPATAEDLDAELMSYTAARSSTDMTAEATAAS